MRMATLVRSLAALLSLSLVVSCSPEIKDSPTQIMVRVDSSNSQLKASFSELRVSLARREGDHWEQGSQQTLSSKTIKGRWPIDLPVVPRSPGDDFKQFQVVLDLMKGGKLLAQNRAVTTFLPNERKMLELWIEACPGHDAGFVCAESDCEGAACEVCSPADGECIAVGVTDPKKLSALTDDAVDVLSERDAGKGGATKDAGRLRDAGLHNGPEEQGDLPGVDDGQDEQAGSDSPSEVPDNVQPDAGPSVPAEPTCVPTAEFCDGKDNDCDGKADDGLTNACGAPCGMAVPPEDCSTTTKDDNCDGKINEGCVVPPAACVPVAEKCDGKDDDCDGAPDNGVKNACGACGAVPVEGCDGKDNDCDGQIDEGVTTTWYRDCDADDYAASAAGSTEACAKPAPSLTCKGWTKRLPSGASLDCDDTNALRFPGATYGVVGTAGDGDLNCDGRVERSLKFLYSNGNYTGSNNYRLCPHPNDLTSAECAGMCVSNNPAILVRGFSLVTGKPTYDMASIENWYGGPGLEPPCAPSTTDALYGFAAIPSDTGGCHVDTVNSDGQTLISVFLRVLCR